MLTKLKIELKSGSRLDFGISSLMQGALMEMIDRDYGDCLHAQGLNPYTQHVNIRDDSITWTVTALTDDAEREIIRPLLSENVTDIYLRHKDLHLEITGKTLESVSYDDLLADTYFGQCPSYIDVEFVTPTSFKVDGRYRNYPTVSNIFKSLVSKHDSIAESTEFYTDDLISQIEEYVDVTGYRLRSTYFHLEGVRIPAFMGSLTLHIRGPQQFVNLINMLIRFGEFSGVGIKTAIGMGAVRIREKKKNLK